MVKEVANIEKIVPIVLGLRKPVKVLQMGASVREIVNMVSLAVVDAGY
ncbi:MAG: phosphate acyltransferase [Cytophagales bacterium]|nr:phosphate acyltransferase [Cytophagales bacterium]